MSTQNIKTWEDIVNMDNRYHQLIDDIIRSGYSSLWDSKVISKIIAALKISKIIEFGYGGIVTDEEWEDRDIIKYCLCKVDNRIFYATRTDHFLFIAFHTDQQREEFMSYPENVELIRNYYMI